MSSTTKPNHAASREFLDLALDHGWSASYVHGKDTGENPFITVTAVREERERVSITWHTRETGTYRLFSCLLGGRGAERDGTLTQAKALVSS